MLKKRLFALLMFTGVTRLLAYLNRRRVMILCYHSVTLRQTPISSEDKLHIPFSLFVKHLEHLQRFYNIISLEAFLEARCETRNLPPRSVVLTFDDGTRNFFTVAAPELNRRRLPATTFIITGQTLPNVPVSSNHEWQPADDHIFLSWPDVQELNDDRIQFGSHTCSHTSLVDLPLEQAEKELIQSRVELSHRLKRNQVALSYPYGECSYAIRALAQKAGYSCGITTMPGTNDIKSDLFALKRTVIAGDDDLSTFAARVCGLTSWFSSIRYKRSPKTHSAEGSISFASASIQEADPSS